jgi:phospholipase/carboxylesterase
MMNKPKEIVVGSSILKIREPETLFNAKVALLLHGWTGDESSMWVFGSKIDQDWLIIAPRAPYPSIDPDLGGYSWVDQSIKNWPMHQDFFPAVNYLKSLIENMSVKFPDANFSEISLIGFSQGAAMAYVYSGIRTASIQKLALLSGFLPEGHEGYVKKHDYKSVDVFIGHGNYDDVVSVNRAIAAKEHFDGYCNRLVYCVTDVGHRLGADCFNAFQKFING